MVGFGVAVGLGVPEAATPVRRAGGRPDDGLWGEEQEPAGGQRGREGGHEQEDGDDPTPSAAGLRALDGRQEALDVRVAVLGAAIAFGERHGRVGLGHDGRFLGSGLLLGQRRLGARQHDRSRCRLARSGGCLRRGRRWPRQPPWPRLTRRLRPACGAGALAQLRAASARLWTVAAAARVAAARRGRRVADPGRRRHRRWPTSSARTRSAGTSSRSLARPPRSSLFESTRRWQAGRPVRRYRWIGQRDRVARA